MSLHKAHDISHKPITKRTLTLIPVPSRLAEPMQWNLSSDWEHLPTQLVKDYASWPAKTLTEEYFSAAPIHFQLVLFEVLLQFQTSTLTYVDKVSFKTKYYLTENNTSSFLKLWFTAQLFLSLKIGLCTKHNLWSSKMRFSLRILWWLFII